MKLIPTKTLTGLAVAAFAASSLSGCAVSDDPAVNTLATVAAAGTVAGLFYSLSDGYYYDNAYNRMPRGYHPADNVRVIRVNSIDDHRRQYPLNQRIIRQQRQENHMLQNQHDRLRSRLYRQQYQNEQMRQRIEQQDRQLQMRRQIQIQPNRSGPTDHLRTRPAGLQGSRAYPGRTFY